MEDGRAACERFKRGRLLRQLLEDLPPGAGILEIAVERPLEPRRPPLEPLCREAGLGVAPYYYRPYVYRPWFYDAWLPYGYPYSWYQPYGYYGRGYDGAASVRLQVEPKETEVFIDGYWAGLLAMLDHMCASGYLRPQHRALLRVVDEVDAVIAALDEAGEPESDVKNKWL